MGGGSAFFHLTPKQAIVSDVNRDLINTYQIMKKCPVELSNMLIKHQENHSVEYYYKIRNEISQDTYMSVMAQYHTANISHIIEELNRKVTQEEYDKVLEDFDNAGLYNGWLQEL